MTQPRDSKGRFASNSAPQDGDITLIVIVCIILASFTYFGYQQGYGMGYSTGRADGISENQPTIFQYGMDKGVEKQKNIDELARNWTKCSWDTYGRDAYCKNDNPGRVRVIRQDYSINFEYTSPNWTDDYWKSSSRTTTCGKDNKFVCYI